VTPESQHWVVVLGRPGSHRRDGSSRGAWRPACRSMRS